MISDSVTSELASSKEELASPKSMVCMRTWIERELSDTIPAIAEVAQCAGLFALAQHLRSSSEVFAVETRKSKTE